jgi:hypothetical protein
LEQRVAKGPEEAPDHGRGDSRSQADGHHPFADQSFGR